VNDLVESVFMENTVTVKCYVFYTLVEKWLPFSEPSIFNGLCYVHIPVGLRPYGKVFVKYFIFKNIGVFVLCLAKHQIYVLLGQI